MHISRSTARKLLLHTQGLDGYWTLPPGKEGAAQVIERLGYVQIDTLYVVQRAHHHAIWSRFPGYAPAMLHELLAQDRRVFEWWTHAMSYVPMTDYRFYAVRMGEGAVRPRTRKWLAENPEIARRVMQRIREEGPLGSADFKRSRQTNEGWWDWKPAKRVLEAKFNMGELMVTERRNFQRIFDLTERVLPPDVDRRPPSDEERQRFIARRVLGGMGVLPAKALRWGPHGSSPVSQDVLHAMQDAGEIVAVTVEGVEAPCYALAEPLEAVTSDPRPPTALHILSPFDPVVIRRRWVEALFDFEYRLECYLPVAKRVYGYFSLPVLWGERFVARLDAKADRKPRTLILRHLHLEPDVDADALLPPLVAALHAFAAFNACDSFSVERVTPATLKPRLVRELT
jgi:hypothetical protein